MSYDKQLRKDGLTSNHEGAVAWRMTPEWELYTTVVTTMGTEDKFYEKGDDRVRRIAELVRKVEPEFVAQLAIYSREEMHLRSVPMLLLVELASCHHGDSLVSRAVSRTVQRADEITELLMCYQWRMGRKGLNQLSHQLRKGLAEAFNRFDEYQFAKYNRTGRKVTLRDALLLVHPKPKNKAQAEIFLKILNDTLSTPYTWETELSVIGKQGFSSLEERDKAQCDTWQQLIKSGRLGYMAVLRNLRNMTNLCIDDESKHMVCKRLANPVEVRKSKQMPFRFLSAYLQLVNDQVFVKERVEESLYFAMGYGSHWSQDAYNTLWGKRWEIQRQMDSLFRRDYCIERKVYRYPIFRRREYYMGKYQACGNILACNARINGEEVKRFPKRHTRRLVKRRLDKQYRQFDSLSERDWLKSQKLEKQLEHIEKRMAELEPKCRQQEELYNKKLEKMRKVESFLEKSYAAERRRRNARLATKGTNREKFIAPILKALEKAVKYTADNINGFGENTRVLLASDVSGSMFRSISERSSVKNYHIGLLLSMLMKQRCENVVAGIFGTDWKVCDFSSDDILRNTVDMVSREGEVGYSTNGYKVIDWLIDENRVMDKVMLFTDCELWNSDGYYGDAHLSKSWDRYKSIAPEAKLYIFNLAGYGTSPIDMKRDDVFCVAGWSDKVFNILAALEQGEDAINVIRQIVV